MQPFSLNNLIVMRHFLRKKFSLSRTSKRINDTYSLVVIGHEDQGSQGLVRVFCSIVTGQRGGVSNKPPVLQAATRHGGGLSIRA